MIKKILSTSNLYEPKVGDVLDLVDKFSNTSGRLVEALAVQELESELSKYHKSKYCVSFSSGFWALVASIVSKSINVGGEIIMPSLTYRRLADVVYWTKHTPVFVDVGLDDLAISPSSVIKSITKNTALILAVHPIVNCCNVNELIDISEKYNIPIIFDAVESVHETHYGEKIGSFGVGEVFSLHACKLMNGAEGGYVCTDDEQFYKNMMKFRNGECVSSSIDLSIESRLCDLHAVLALACLNELDLNVSHCKEVYAKYKTLLSKNPYVRLLEFDENEQTAYKNIVIEILDGSAIDRDTLILRLNNESILARAYYSPPLHLKSSTYRSVVTDMTNTEFLMTRYLNLPCGSRVSVRDVERVCYLMTRAFTNNE